MADDPDYKLNVTIRASGLEVPRVPCRVYLPKAKPGAVVLAFYPTRQQANKLASVFECSVEGNVRDLAGLQTKVRAHRVYLHGTSTKYWGTAQWEVSLKGEPSDLRVVQTYPPRAALKGRVVGAFWLTPSLMLAPSKMIERSVTGDVKVQTVRQVTFRLQSGVQLTFDTHYQYTKGEAGQSVTFPELVGTFEHRPQLKGRSKVSDSFLQQVDDFLRVVSFGERQRCACVGWDAADTCGVERHFRRDISIPAVRKDQSLNDAVIDIKDFQEFAQITYDRLAAETSPLVRQALAYALYREDRTVENSFMTAYAAIETLFLHHRRANGWETILNREAWQSVVRGLKQCLRSNPWLSTDRVARGLIYEKLPELNRVSFGRVFESFCQRYGIDVRDLWPVARDSSGITLSDIRNRLVHGEHFNPPQLVALIVALQHLRWIAERMILGFFGWPVARSNVSGRSLASNTRGYRNWREHQSSFST